MSAYGAARAIFDVVLGSRRADRSAFQYLAHAFISRDVDHFQLIGYRDHVLPSLLHGLSSAAFAAANATVPVIATFMSKSDGLSQIAKIQAVIQRTDAYSAGDAS
jgi:hypothetical protein